MLIADRVAAYVEAHTTPPPAFMDRLADDTRATLRVPQMLTGRVEGRLLEMLVWVSGARLVLDVGTYSGYSALSMAAALAPGGRVITCEASSEHAAFARRHIEASPYADRVEVREGPAAETIRGLDGPFDFVFVDADKTGYAEYVELGLERLAERGLLVVDNTLWQGRVLDPDTADDEATRAIVALNDALVADPRVICVQLSVRDGVTLVRRAA